MSKVLFPEIPSPGVREAWMPPAGGGPFRNGILPTALYPRHVVRDPDSTHDEYRPAQVSLGKPE